MATEPEINAQCDKLVIISANEMVWEPAGQRGVSRTVLERVNNEEFGRETALSD